MSDTSTRFGIVEPSADRHDSADVPLYIRNIVTQLEGLGVMFGQGTLANRPVAGVQGRIYAATDQTPQRLYYDNGSAWFEIGIVPAGSVTDTMLASPGNATHRILARSTALLSGLAVSTWLLTEDGGVYSAGAGSPSAKVPIIDIQGSILTVPGKSARLSLLLSLFVNGTAPGGGFAANLYPVGSGGGTPGQLIVNAGVADPAMSATISPGAGTSGRLASIDVVLPADGPYALGFAKTITGMAANSMCLMTIELRVRYV